MFTGQLCVVLNNQHQERIQQAAEACKTDPRAITIFQPYTKKNQRRVANIVAEYRPLRVPIFLIAGNYGATVSAIGLLENIEYQNEMSENRKSEILRYITDADGLYAVNVISITNVIQLRAPLKLSRFAKAKNEKYLSPGQWTASICHLPNISELIEAI